jgi:TolB protein
VFTPRSSQLWSGKSAARIALLASCVLLALLVARSAGAAVGVQGFPVAATALNDELSPAISGTVVVWQDERASRSEIFGRDLSGGEEFPVATGPGARGLPAISGDVVVWSEEQARNRDIYAYDISENRTVRITSHPAEQRRPAVSGDIVVWEDRQAGNWDIFGYDLDDGRRFRITSNRADQRDPAVSGGFVVWTDHRNGEADVYGRDLSGGEEFQVTTAAGWQDMPAIDGRTVVWRDGRNGGETNIRGRYLGRSGEFAVASGPSDQWAPAVSGRVVVWADNRNNRAGVYGRDLSTGEAFVVADGGGWQEAPAISGRTAVWESQSGADPVGPYDVFGAELDLAPAPPTDLRAAGSFGGVDLSWRAGPEPDLAGYNVYGARNQDDPFRRLNAQPVTSNSYRDPEAPGGRLSYYRVSAVDRNGSESVRSSTVRAAALVRSSIGLRVDTARILYGGSVRFSGTLVSGGSPLRSRLVYLERRIAGSDAFTRVSGGGRITSADGRFTLVLSPARIADYRMRFGGEPLLGIRPSVSPVVQVEVRAKISLRTALTSNSTDSGQRRVISGQVTPRNSGSVRVEIRREGRLVVTRSLQLGNSRYEMTYEPPGPGHYTVRAFFPGTRTSLASASAPAKFIVAP